MSECRPIVSVHVEEMNDEIFVCQPIDFYGEPKGDVYVGWDSEATTMLIPEIARHEIGLAIACQIPAVEASGTLHEGRTELELLLARALWQHSYLLSSIYVQLGKKTIPIYSEMQKRMQAIPTELQPWLNSKAVTDGQS